MSRHERARAASRRSDAWLHARFSVLATTPPARRWRERRPPRFQDSGRCFPVSCAPAAAALLADCWSSCKSVPASFGATSACRKPIQCGRTAESDRPLPAPTGASHSPMAARVWSVISNCTGRPVFFWTTVARSRTLPPTHTSSIFSRTRSQPLSLLSMARLNRVRSRRRSSS